MSIRDDLATRLAGAGSAIAWEPDDDAYLLADAVLAWLGQLDPDADAELIALHLRDSRAELERLRDIAARARLLVVACEQRLSTAGYHAIELQADALVAALKKEAGDA